MGPDETGNGFRFIHASRRGIKISSSSEDYYANRLLGARRILPDFLPDTGNGSAENFDSTYVAFKDTLELGEDDYRILLLSDGTWACVLEKGTVQRPSWRNAKIVLDTNGRWVSLPISYHTIPSLTAPVSSSVSSDKGNSQASNISSKIDDTSGDAVYHTIKKGDTLLAIARRYHSSVSAICRFNGITERTVLKIGRKLRVK
ncbi:MAG: LysM peptidoglycan-binding domain-containing protein [Alistipes sp.]|nr:LysM peptidoglycan-binding domain-containing protein [Candidatus Minthomonas equi]